MAPSPPWPGRRTGRRRTGRTWREQLFSTLAHEFTHHIEGRAGERGLERKDEQFMEEFRAGRGE